MDQIEQIADPKVAQKKERVLEMRYTICAWRAEQQCYQAGQMRRIKADNVMRGYALVRIWVHPLAGWRKLSCLRGVGDPFSLGDPRFVQLAKISQEHKALGPSSKRNQD